MPSTGPSRGRRSPVKSTLAPHVRSTLASCRRGMRRAASAARAGNAPGEEWLPRTPVIQLASPISACPAGRCVRQKPTDFSELVPVPPSGFSGSLWVSPCMVSKKLAVIIPLLAMRGMGSVTMASPCNHLTGRSNPSLRTRLRVQAPVHKTTFSVAMVPLRVVTPVTRPPWVSIPVAWVCVRTSNPRSLPRAT